VSVFARSGSFIVRHPLVILTLWIVATFASAMIAIFGIGGPTIFDSMETDRPAVPGSDSQAAYDLMNASPSGTAVVELVRDIDLTSPDVVASAGTMVTAARADLAALTGVAQVADPWLTPAGPADPAVMALLSQDGRGFLIQVTLDPGLDDEAAKDVGATVANRLADVGQSINEAVGGTHLTSSVDLIMRELNAQMERELFRAESISLPAALVVMMIVFGGFLAAGMPIIGALAAITTGLGGMMLINAVMPLDSVIINVITIIGLGLSIDYGLLVVSRFREELTVAGAEPTGGPSRRDPAIQAAAYRTVVTAGRTVTFSALTITVCVLGLLTMRPPLLRGIGVGAAMSVLLAMLAATSLVPAILTLLGRRFVRPSPLRRIPGLRRLISGVGDVITDQGAFARLARGVQRRPWFVGLAVLVLLLAAASLIGGLQMRSTGTDMIDPQSEQGQYYTELDGNYPLLATPDLYVVTSTHLDEAHLATLAERLETVAHVDRVSPPVDLDGGDGSQLFQIQLDVADSGGPDAVAAVEAIRDLGEPIHVAGDAADQVDFQAALLDGLPLAGPLIVLAVILLLFFMTGSLVVPLKALLVNGLSILASLGIAQWVFTTGHGFSVTGIEIYVVAIVVAFGFGLAMDYEVFLLDRIKEVYDRTGDNDLAVRLGLQRSGRIITSAASVIIVVFLGFALGDLAPLRQAGVTLAIVVALDATLVRMLLVPATMTILGRANWWAPGPLQRLAARFAGDSGTLTARSGLPAAAPAGASSTPTETADGQAGPPEAL
jgi:RND superfamily putative drug exporter